MKKKTFALGFVAALALPLAALALPEFHTATTPQEKALDAILMQQKKDAQMDEYLLRDGTSEGDAQYGKYFTPAYKKAVLKAQAAQMKKECGGHAASGESCGLSFSPVTCGQDTTDTVYLYRTIKANSKEATIAYSWPKEAEVAATYHLRNVDGAWKIDGARCADAANKFNMK